MKTLLRHIKRSLIFRLLYRLVCWINYPTSRERMWHMYSLGVYWGRKEALAELPITKVQPRQETEPLKVHLPPGEWTRQWNREHLTKYGVMPIALAEVPTAHDLTQDCPDWLIGVNDPTAKVPAIKKQAYQEFHKRHAG